MSLNGLDNTQVAEAYTAASAEPGGWFLLKYASRDEVEILSKGNGGITEMRNAVAAYEETNPLYGYLKYRRRNVLVKYLPEDCSRLIQARVAVHFNAVCERFSPYDSQFDIATSDELRDSRLSAACSLHAATGSNSSAGSNGKKHLMEIAEEDEEEVQQPAKRQSLIKESNDEDKENQDSGINNNKRRSVTGPDVTLNKDSTEPKFSESSTSDVPNFVGAAAADPGAEASTTAAGASAGGESRRLSSQSSRAEVFTSYSAYSAYAYSKPKVKLGPRPSLDTNTRPQTAGNFRPVSSIPAGFKLFGKNGSAGSVSGSVKSKSGRKDSIGSQNSGVVGSPQSELTEISFSTLPIPEEPNTSVKNAIESARPNTSSGVSTKSGMTMGSKAAMTPEKARLKKAMALREKKKKKAAKETKDTLEVPTTTTTEDKSDAEGDDAEQPAAETEETPAAAAERVPIIKADSGISINASPASTKDSETTQESRPTSPAEEQSTKASSVSDSTEQAVEGETKGEEPSSNGSTPKPSEAEEAIPATTSTVEPPAASEEVAVNSAEVEEKSVAEETKTEPEVKANEKETEETTPPATANSENEPQIAQAEAPEPEPMPVAAPKDNIPVAPEETTPAQPTQDSPQPETQVVPDPDPAQSKDDSDAETISQPAKQPSARRRPIEPIRTDLAQKDRPVSTTQTELNFSDNDELLDELQSATVEEAKPMLVTKTPLTPVFPGKPFGASPSSPASTGGNNKPTVVRTVSNPVRGNLAAINSDVSQSSARSVSQGAAYLHQITQQRNGDSLAKKQGNMGSTIANRIKALELLSVNTAETASPPGSRPSSQFFSVKKDRVPSRSPSLADRANSLSRDNRPDTAQSRNSPEESRLNRERSGSISSRLSMFEPADSPGNTPRGRPETISVTAKIIRDSPSTSRNREGPVELKQSPLLVDHHQQGHPSTPELTVNEPEASRPTEPTRDTDSRRSSFSMMRDFLKEGRKSISSPSTDNLHSTNNTHRPPSTHQNSSFSQRLSISSRRSLSKDRTGDGVASILSDDESTSDKKPSRTSRLMRRLSSLSGSSSRNNINSNHTLSPHHKVASPPLGTPTVTEEILPSASPSAPSPIATYMGDVNVQFPDTLLWKRRIMYLDSQGYVILSALPQTQGGTKNKTTTGVKRYHLGEFRTPYAPDVEVQELPNSVVLDLVEGSSVQVACEDRTGQMSVLQTLREAHAAHAGQ